MPELPEVETMRRGALAAIGGVVVSARRTRIRKKPLTMTPAWPSIARHLAGQRLDGIGRRGKRLLLQFANERCLIIEPRMTGLLLVDGAPDTGHLRFELTFRGGGCSRLAYWDSRGLGRVLLVDPPALADYLSPLRIGPDALEITPETLRDNLRGRRIPVKVGLMDQKAVAGIGNIYASEILHLCRMDPRRSCIRVSRCQWETIHRAMLAVLNKAIQMEGSTLSDGSYRNALNQPGEYQNHHRVYDRAGETCLRCGNTSIRRIVQAQRSTYYCPRCQR